MKLNEVAQPCWGLHFKTNREERWLLRPTQSTQGEPGKTGETSQQTSAGTQPGRTQGVCMSGQCHSRRRVTRVGGSAVRTGPDLDTSRQPLSIPWSGRGLCQRLLSWLLTCTDPSHHQAAILGPAAQPAQQSDLSPSGAPCRGCLTG